MTLRTASAIPPVPADVERPFWSVMIPTYNDRGFLRETIQSVLTQDAGPAQMQIEVVDNCSEHANPRSVLDEIGGGRVEYYRQSRTTASYHENWNTAIRRARGHWVHLLHDDDLVRPGFYAAMRRAAESEPDLSAAFCREEVIDATGRTEGCLTERQSSSGVLVNWMQLFVPGNPVCFPGMVIKRSTYEAVGGFDSIVNFCADWLMWVRAALHGPIWYDPQPLAAYRCADMRGWPAMSRVGLDVADIYRVLEMIELEIPASPEVQKLVNNGRIACRQRAIHNSCTAVSQGDVITALAQFHQLRLQEPAGVMKECHAALKEHANEFLQTLNTAASQSSRDGNPSALSMLRAKRRQLASQLIEVPIERFEEGWGLILGEWYFLVMTSGLQSVRMTEEEEQFHAALFMHLQDAADRRWINRWLAAALYSRPIVLGR